jgi:hypothetical protein
MQRNSTKQRKLVKTSQNGKDPTPPPPKKKEGKKRGFSFHFFSFLVPILWFPKFGKILQKEKI